MTASFLQDAEFMVEDVEGIIKSVRAPAGRPLDTSHPSNIRRALLLAVFATERGTIRPFQGQHVDDHRHRLCSQGPAGSWKAVQVHR